MKEGSPNPARALAECIWTVVPFSLTFYTQVFPHRTCCDDLALSQCKNLYTDVRFVMSVLLSVRMEQLCPHWMDFHEIWYLSIFRKSIKKIRVSLKPDKNNFTWRTAHIYDHISLDSSPWDVLGTSCRGEKNTHFVFSKFFLKIVPFMR
jgi:hypothetical protein